MNCITIKPAMLNGVVDISRIKEDKLSLISAILVAGAIGNNIFCKGLNVKEDERILKIAKIIEMSGGKIIESKRGVSVKMTANMCKIEVDIRGVEEMIPFIAVLCAFCKGESRIYGGEKLRKSGNILRAIASEFNHLGVYTKITSNGLMIRGVQVIQSDGAYSWNNSNLAIALDIIACRAEGEINLMGTDELVDDKYNKFLKIKKSLNGGGLR